MLFDRIAGMFNSSDIEDDQDGDFDDDFDDWEDDLRVSYPEDFDPLYKKDQQPNPGEPMNTNLVRQIVAELDHASPATLGAARDRLGDLIAAVRGSVEEMLAQAQPNYTAISERAAAIETLVAAMSELDKAEATATAALERIWKRLYSERNQQRVWAKLRNGTPKSEPEPNTI